jgi:hypothetical protein
MVVPPEVPEGIRIVDAVVAPLVPSDVEPAISCLANPIGKSYLQDLRVREIRKPDAIDEPVQSEERRPDFVQRSDVERSELSVQIVVR